MGDNNWSYSKIYKEIKPYEEYGMYDVAWHDGMSAADGHIGVITSCAPLNDSFISVSYTHRDGYKRQTDKCRQNPLVQDRVVIQ